MTPAMPTPRDELRGELDDLRGQIASVAHGPPVWPRVVAALFGAFLGLFSSFFFLLMLVFQSD
jgi:hypothetical protein